MVSYDNTPQSNYQDISSNSFSIIIIDKRPFFKSADVSVRENDCRNIFFNKISNSTDNIWHLYLKDGNKQPIK